VPVGARTLACELRQPCFSPSRLPTVHCFVASRLAAMATALSGSMASLAVACLTMTRWWADALRA